MNDADSPVGGYAWFVAKGPPTGTGTSYRGGSLRDRRLAWSGTTASWADTSWQELVEPSPTYRNYFDLTGVDKRAPQLGETDSIALGTTGSRLMMAVVRQVGSQSYLWTCQHAGFDGTDNDYDGSETGSTMDRSGIQWLKAAINTSGTPLTYSAHDRICDTASSTPYYYYMPSLIVNSSGDLVVGFSGSKSTERIGAFFSGRRASATLMGTPVLIQAGRDFCNPQGSFRWGDYSYTPWILPTEAFGRCRNTQKCATAVIPNGGHGFHRSR